jgi:site-specific DNA-cytosine methylase
MSSPTFIDCNGLAAFMSYGFTQAGMTMVARTGTLNFGNPVAEANRKYLGDQWSSFFSDSPDEWPDTKADVVMGCPPCSGWSVWSGMANRGPDAKAHEHTKAFMKYAARIKPRLIVFECVQQAYTQGRETMVKYRDMVEELSGKKYDLYHVKMNNLQVGGFSYRQRYFWVAVEEGLKFGASIAPLTEYPTLIDVIGDLENLEVMWEAQRYNAEPSKFVAHLRSADGTVDGHMNKQNGESQKIKEIFDILGDKGWKPMMALDIALREAVAQNGDKFPQSFSASEEKIRAKDYQMGYSLPCRWDKNSWCHVLTGGGLDHTIHPTQQRRITHREAARIQGLPDDWQFSSLKTYSALAATWGKAVPVQAATWIGDAVKAALEGQPSGPQGELIGDREYLLDTDRGFTRSYAKKNFYPLKGTD